MHKSGKAKSPTTVRERVQRPSPEARGAASELEKSYRREQKIVGEMAELAPRSGLAARHLGNLAERYRTYQQRAGRRAR